MMNNLNIEKNDRNPFHNKEVTILTTVNLGVTQAIVIPVVVLDVGGRPNVIIRQKESGAVGS
jgi:hypothetical protein